MRRMLSTRALFGVLVVVAVANVAIFCLQRWVVLPVHVPTASMEPAVREGERLLVRRTFDSPEQLARSVERGDVLVFRSPQQGEPLVVKRVIALPGEVIQALDGLVAIDDVDVLDEEWLPEAMREPGSTAMRSVDIERTVLGADEVFVMGDNRADSIDSRSFGPVPLDRVVGTVSFRFWPPSRWGSVEL